MAAASGMASRCGTGHWQLGLTACCGRHCWPAQRWQLSQKAGARHGSHGRSNWLQSAAVGVQLDLADPQPVSRAAVPVGCEQRQLEQLMDAAKHSGATKVRHYVFGTRGGGLLTPPASACQLRICQACGSAAGDGRWRSGAPAPFGDWKKLGGGTTRLNPNCVVRRLRCPCVSAVDS